MYCVHCGTGLKKSFKHCPHCGQLINDSNRIEPLIADGVIQLHHTNPSFDPEYLQSFVWPLFTFPWFYMYAMKYRWYEVLPCIVFTVPPFLGLIVFIALPYAAGGRKRAYRQRAWKSDADFLACQKVWENVTGAYWQLILLGSVIYILFALYHAYSNF